MNKVAATTDSFVCTITSQDQVSAMYVQPQLLVFRLVSLWASLYCFCLLLFPFPFQKEENKTGSMFSADGS